MARIAYRSVRADERGKQMKRLFIAMTLVVLQWQLPAIAQTGKAMTVAELAAYNKPDREKVLYEGAKKEGKLMWYTSLTGGPNTDAPKVFEAKYSGVAMEVYRGDSDALISRITQEAQAKRYIVDTIETTFPILKVLQELKLLAPYFSPHLAQYPDDVKEKSSQGLVYWATDRESYIGLAYNTNAVQGAAVPKNFEDLLKPELKGKIGFATHRCPRDRRDAYQQGLGVCPKAQVAADQPALGVGAGDSRHGDFRRTRRLTHGLSQSLSRFDLQGRADQVGADGSCTDQRRRGCHPGQRAPSPCRAVVR